MCESIIISSFLLMKEMIWKWVFHLCVGLERQSVQLTVIVLSLACICVRCLLKRFVGSPQFNGGCPLKLGLVLVWQKNNYTVTM